MNLFVSGSTAYDYLMTFDWKYKDHINSEDIHNFTLSLLIDKMKKESWGTWLNIAYNLALLWDKPLLFSAIWKDFVFNEFCKNNINLDYIHKSEDLFSAAWYITTDKNENQITAFYPWAMMEADKDYVKPIEEKLAYWIVSADKKEAMLKHLKYLNENNVKCFFDPGQWLMAFWKEDLIEASNLSNYLILNNYEYSKFKEISELNDEQINNFYEKIIITNWSEWSKIISKNESEIKISAVKVESALDPTWAWDSYRAWLLRWLQLWYSWEKSAKIWALIASFCIWKHWWQNHFVEKKEFEERFLEEFGDEVKLK